MLGQTLFEFYKVQNSSAMQTYTFINLPIYIYIYIYIYMAQGIEKLSGFEIENNNGDRFKDLTNLTCIFFLT